MVQEGWKKHKTGDAKGDLFFLKKNLCHQKEGKRNKKHMGSKTENKRKKKNTKRMK